MRNNQGFGKSRLTVVVVVSLTLLCGVASAQEQDAGSRYAQMLADSEIMARYNAQIERSLQAQQSRLVDLQQQFAGLDATGAEIAPLLNKMFAQLEAFIATDLPFIDPSQASADHRAERLDKLRVLMVDETASVGEKFRRTMEAIQIEIEYGRNMASYKGKLPDGREAFYVRVGRVSLLYRTADGEETGYWDAQQKAWVVDNDYAEAVETAIQVASKLKAPDLSEVPVPAPQEVRS